MKKISRLSTISSVVALAFIVPQIAFAAWWNPLSWFNGWSFFYRADNPTQVLENRIKELEKKLGGTATSSAVFATTTATKDTPQVVSPKTIPVVAEKKQETPQTNQSPIISKETKLEISNVRAIPSAYKVSILWNTSVASNGKVTLWPMETASGNIIGNTTNTTSHQVDIQTMSRKTYYYLVESSTVGGQNASSEQKEITTPFDSIVPIINSVAISRSATFIDFSVAASEPVKITLQYNYSTLMEGEGAFTATSTNVFSENSHVSVRMPDDGYFPLTSVISVKITAYDQSLNPSIQYKQTVKIADITME